MASYRAVLYGNTAFSILVFSTEKRYSTFVKKILFSENLLQKSIENVQNFQWFSRKNVSISRAEGFFENH